MPRIARAVVVGYPYYITQRGNYQQEVFKDETDYRHYLKLLDEYSKKYLLKIWAYCLMSNHVHHIAVPQEPFSLAKTFNTLHMRYSQYFNKKREVRGHLWQGRFFSCALDEQHLYEAIRYVENSPVRAKITERPEDYPWSSGRCHVFHEPNSILDDDCYLAREIKDWSAYLMEKEDGVLIEDIRDHMKTGRPCGHDGFIQQIELLLKRRLKALPRGRPRGKG
jgi:putative transposase